MVLSNRPLNALRLSGSTKQYGDRMKSGINHALLPLQPGDVPDTYADVDDLVREFDYRPSMPVRDGIERFVSWYREYYGH